MLIKSDPDDLKDASTVIKESEIDMLTIDLTATHKILYYDIYKQICSKGELQEKKDKINDSNLRVRLILSTLYSVATNYEYLVVGTENLAEWYTGYFTKYGDGGVDIQPLMDLTKGEVKDLAKHLGVTKDIIDKVPSADLWEGQ